MTGITVKFGSQQNPIKNTYSYRFGGGGDSEMLVELNGGVSRIASRPYNSCYYYIANEINKQEVIIPVVLPNYDEVINDKEGKQFKFVKCNTIPEGPPPSYGSS